MAKRKSAKTRHVEKRVMERFGRKVTEEQCAQWERMIQDGEATPLDIGDGEIVRWVVPFEDGEVVVVYRAKERKIVTAMPIKWFRRDIGSESVEFLEDIALERCLKETMKAANKYAKCREMHGAGAAQATKARKDARQEMRESILKFGQDLVNALLGDSDKALW